MSIADLNLVFGKNEEPMIQRVDDIILPALQSALAREIDKNTKYFFWDIKLEELRDREFIIRGLLIKDTILDIDSRFVLDKGLEHMNLRVPSAPYSAFVIYLKNHKLAFVKNGKGSPTIRNFASTLRDILVKYIHEENELRKKLKQEFLPYCILNVTGIKTEESIRNALRGITSVSELKLKFFPLNSEWDDGSLMGAIDEKWRKVLQSKNGSLLFNSPKSVEGVIKVTESLEGYADVEMRVNYPSDSLIEGKKSVRIKNGKLSENTTIDLSTDLDSSYEEIDGYCKEKNAMNKMTNNLIIDYEEFVKKHRK